MDSPEVWRWIWLAGAVVFTVGEIANGGSLFVLPFAIGAVAAAILAFAGVDVVWEWLAFVVVSGLALAALYPVRRRLDQEAPQDGIGARRLLGQPGTVLDALPGGFTASGLVRVGREDWRAESVDGSPIPAGTPVKVVEVRGTRVVVHPLSALDQPRPDDKES